MNLNFSNLIRGVFFLLLIGIGPENAAIITLNVFINTTGRDVGVMAALAAKALYLCWLAMVVLVLLAVAVVVASLPPNNSPERAKAIASQATIIWSQVGSEEKDFIYLKIV